MTPQNTVPAAFVELVERAILEEDEIRELEPPSWNQQPAIDPALVARGENAFYASCTDCHDAERAFQKQKTRAGWRATVQRMAAKDGADVSPADIEPIAAYLASVAGAEVAGEAGPWLVPLAGSGTTLSATLSPVFRGADHRNAAENPGFFADAWVGMDFQTPGPLSGRVMLCTSCHNSRQGFSIEVAEASATLDLIHALSCPSGPRPDTEFEANVKGGRFIVPFGAFSSMSHPGAYRTLTNPLMYNMGRRVFGNVGPPRQPVLPMPYADEGLNLHTKVPVLGDGAVTFDLYTVNGLQQEGIAPGIGSTSIFFTSRAYIDNNALPAIGGRVTVGNSYVRLGGSMMTGELQNPGAAQREYKIGGVDATLNYDDFIRFYFEYAIRRNDATIPGLEDTVYGIVNELEVKLWGQPRVGMLARYDTLEYRDTFGPNAAVDRFTWGFNITLPGGSLLIVNHEHWMFPDPQEDIDIVGFRWTTTL